MGLDVEKMLNGDFLDFSLRARITERASELRMKVLDDNLAVAVINRLGEALEKGRGS